MLSLPLKSCYHCKVKIIRHEKEGGTNSTGSQQTRGIFSTKSERERERERQRDRQTDRQTERHTQTQRETERDRDRDRQADTQTDTERDRDRQTDRQTDRQRQNNAENVNAYMERNKNKVTRGRYYFASVYLRL